MDNFKQGLIKAIDDNDFDIDTLKVAKGCPKREELLLIIDEVKNRNSLKYGEELDDQNEDVKNDKVQSENKSTQQNAVSTDDDEEMLALELLSSSYDELPFLGNKRIEVPSLPVPTDPDNEALALPAPTDPDYDIDRMFEFDDLDLNFDDENTDFERAIEQDFDLEMNELDKLPQNILDRDDHKNELLRSFEEDSRPTPKNDDEPTAPKKRNRLSV
ncbi:hypothetical protein ACPSKX_04085 [Moritella viscosa]